MVLECQEPILLLNVIYFVIKKLSSLIQRLLILNLFLAAPKIKLPERYKTTVMFEKDEQVTLRIPYTGNPQPSAKWFKGTEEIKPSETYQVDISHHYVTLKINKPNNSFSGVYNLKLSNSLGSDTCEIKIQIAGLCL